MKLSDRQVVAIQLMLRTKSDSDGWMRCAPAVHDRIIAVVPSDLVESRFSEDGIFIRLTGEGRIVAKWLV